MGRHDGRPRPGADGAAATLAWLLRCWLLASARQPSWCRCARCLSCDAKPPPAARLCCCCAHASAPFSFHAAPRCKLAFPHGCPSHASCRRRHCAPRSTQLPAASSWLPKQHMPRRSPSPRHVPASQLDSYKIVRCAKLPAPLTLFAQVGLALLHGRHDHVAGGGGGQAVQARAPAVHLQHSYNDGCIRGQLRGRGGGQAAASGRRSTGQKCTRCLCRASLRPAQPPLQTQQKAQASGHQS